MKEEMYWGSRGENEWIAHRLGSIVLYTVTKIRAITITAPYIY